MASVREREGGGGEGGRGELEVLDHREKDVYK